MNIGTVETPVWSAWSLCDVGHQGLFLDKEIGLYDNRRRVLHPRFGRFMQRDPMGYADGLSLYQYVLSAPTGLSDSQGLYSGDPCCCEDIRIQFKPDPPKKWLNLGRKGGGYNFGFAMKISFKVSGNWENCVYRQDEEGKVTSSGGDLTREREDPHTGEITPAGNQYKDAPQLGPNKLKKGDLTHEGGGWHSYEDHPHGFYPDSVKGEVAMEMDFHVVISCRGTDGWTVERTFHVTGSQKADRSSSASSGSPRPPILQPGGSLDIKPYPPAKREYQGSMSQ